MSLGYDPVMEFGHISIKGNVTRDGFAVTIRKNHSLCSGNYLEIGGSGLYLMWIVINMGATGDHI
jgi:hypothetical protein